MVHLICFLLLSILSSVSSQVNFTALVTNDTIASNLVHPAWDKHIKDLEHLLEVDLERVELDAKDAASVAAQPNGTNLADDLLRVRLDIDRLVSSVKEVEEELGRTQHKIDEEEKDIAQKNAEIETEKFLDGLHRGKLNVKVDYVTGQLVSKPKSLKRKTKRVQNTMATKQDATVTNSTSASRVDRSLTRAVSSDSMHRMPLVTPQIHQGFNEVVNAAAGNTDDDEFVEQKKKASETVRQHIETHPDLQTRIKEEMEFLKSGSDPAVLFVDLDLMLDIVKLAMTASLFGLAAVFLKLPPTAGFLIGGMMIGPSCFDVVGEIHQVQTLAQFGAIFLLFEQGLLYSQTYSDESFHGTNDEETIDEPDEGEIDILPPMTSGDPRNTPIHRGHAKQPEKISEPTLPQTQGLLSGDDHDPNIVGSIILILLVFVALAVVVLTGVANSISEATMVSCTIALCSTTIITETLQAAHIADTHWGIGVLKMIVSLVPYSTCPTRKTVSF